MTESSRLPIAKYVKVRFRSRRNKIKAPGQEPTTSYTLYWREFGKKKFQSLGQHATRAFAERMAREKEAELNSPQRRESLKPAAWKDFVKAYLDETYPGHDLPAKERKEKSPSWKKSLGTMTREKLSLNHFERITKPGWSHDIDAADRDRFVTERLAEVGSAATIDVELHALHTLCKLMEERGHRVKGENPFAGKAKVDDRRRRNKARGKGAKARHYALEEIKKLLALADEEAQTWEQKRFRTLVHFVAYTGCRIAEVQHLEWKDLDFEKGVAWLYFKVENDLKTEGSEAPFGLPGPLLAVLGEWEAQKANAPAKCDWVFPNSRGNPWKGGAPGYRPFDQIQALGKRAGVKEANFKKFRHSLATLGKGCFGMTAEQVKAQLRHTTTDTQRHYSHDDLASLRDAVKGIDFGK